MSLGSVLLPINISPSALLYTQNFFPPFLQGEQWTENCGFSRLQVDYRGGPLCIYHHTWFQNLACSLLQFFLTSVMPTRGSERILMYYLLLSRSNISAPFVPLSRNKVWAWGLGGGVRQGTLCYLKSPKLGNGGGGGGHTIWHDKAALLASYFLSLEP